MDVVSSATYVARRLPLFRRIYYFIRLLSFQTLVKAFILYRTRIQPSPPSARPTYTKSYPVRPKIENRVFIPASYKAGDAPLPLIIDIHGGGFAIGAPVLDDKDNIVLSQKHGFVVVSIGYSLAPLHPFPTAVHDVAALINAVLDDTTLPVDKSRVAVAGYSAGANLALCATQMDGLSKRVKAVVAYYPPTDFTRNRDMKLETATPPPGGKDILTESSRLFNYGYLNPGQDLKDPLLSPIWAKREALPKWLYLLGCEYDMLCREAQDMASEMAERDESGEERKIVKDELGAGFEQGKIKWMNVLNTEHGFNQRAMMVKGEKKELWQRKTDLMHASVAAWLKEKALA